MSFQKIAVPAARSSAAQLQVRRKVVIALLVACVLGAIVSVPLSLSALGQAGKAAAPELPTKAIAVAEEAGRDFLASRKSVVPAASGVRTDFSLDHQGQPAEKSFEPSTFSYSGHAAFQIGDEGAPQTLVRIVRFRVTLGGQSYYLDVPIHDDPAAGPVLGDAPVLVPAPAGEREAVKGLSYDDIYSDAETSVDPAVMSSVERWVSIYPQAGVNSEELRTVTGDQDPSHRYSGLGGWTGEVLEVVSALPIGGTEADPRRSGVIVQIRVALTPPAANGPTLSTTYDLYVVTEGSPAQPPVVAWGPAGSSEYLTELTNVN